MKNLADVVQPVTAFFEIDRQMHDGRTTSEYLSWLSETLHFFPNAIVFHDQSIDSNFISKHKSATFFLCSIQDLPLYFEISKIRKICDSPIGFQSSDLVYRSPEYGIVVNSKFHFLSMATKHSSLDFFMWVDAGYSRFSSFSVSSSPIKFTNLGRFESLFQLSVKGLIRNLITSRSNSIENFCKVGNSARILCGISFLLSREMIPQAEDVLTSLHNAWLDEGKWDTEQVAIIHVITQLNSTFVFEFNNYYDSMLRYLQNPYIRAANIMASKALLRIITK